MALWVPGPWGAMDGEPVKQQPESSHQVAIAEPVQKADEPQPRRRRASTAQD